MSLGWMLCAMVAVLHEPLFFFPAGTACSKSETPGHALFFPALVCEYCCTSSYFYVCKKPVPASHLMRGLFPRFRLLCSQAGARSGVRSWSGAF